MFIAGISATLAALDNPLLGNGRPKQLAELQAAILAQRQLSANFLSRDRYTPAAVGLHTHITQHNLAQPWNTVLQVHKDALVRRPHQPVRSLCLS